MPTQGQGQGQATPANAGGWLIRDWRPSEWLTISDDRPQVVVLDPPHPRPRPRGLGCTQTARQPGCGLLLLLDLAILGCALVGVWTMAGWLLRILAGG